MPITVLCPSCSRKLTAPDNLAGKRAKCPSCRTVMQIPLLEMAEPVYDAEEVPDTPPRPAAPPDPDIYEIAASEPQPAGPPVIPAPPRPSAGPEAERTWCPLCGESIVKGAVKCRFCGGELQAGRKSASAATGSDAPAVMGLVFGVVSLVVIALGCMSCGAVGIAAYPLATLTGIVGLIISINGKGNLRIAGIVLNALAITPAVILFILVLVAMAAAK